MCRFGWRSLCGRWLGRLSFALLLVAVARAESVPAATVHYLPPPAGFISFCIRFADQCAALPGTPTEVALSSQRWRTLKQVNADVNASIWPEDDQAHYGRPEYWTIPTDGLGDCDDYALTKRRDLISSGFPERALRIAIVTTPGRHAVLIIATDKGDFVLDNLTDRILEKRQTDYTWIEQQDAINPRAWISLLPMSDANRQSAVGSIK